MGFLEIQGGGLDIGLADFSQAVFSFWFRIPLTTISAAVAQFETAWNADDGFTNFNMPGMIPLVSYGPTEQYNFNDGFSSFNSQMSRSVIGVYCGNQPFYDDDDRTPKLYCKMQYSSGDRNNPGASQFASYNDFFEVGSRTAPANFIGSTPGPTPPSIISVSAGRWHHALVSFDLTGCSSVVGGPTPSFPTTSKFWWAFDDGNKNGNFVGPYAPKLYGAGAGGDNDIVSAWCFAQTNSFVGGALPVASSDFGIPATAADVDSIGVVEMAEFQLFTGVSVDTGDLAVRRLFVTELGKPAPMVGAAAALGPPVIALAGFSNWIAGISTGTAGNLNPIGTIIKFTPGPGLGS